MAKITIAYFRKVYNEFLQGKITMSRMVEKLNERAKDEEKCKVCGKEFDAHALRATGKCTACFTSNA